MYMYFIVAGNVPRVVHDGERGEVPVSVSEEYLSHDEEPIVVEPDGQDASVGQHVAHEEEGQR